MFTLHIDRAALAAPLSWRPHGPGRWETATASVAATAFAAVLPACRQDEHRGARARDDRHEGPSCGSPAAQDR
jgi:hypothetical protein